MNLPLLSIVIPHYNQIDYLPQTIASAISQTYENIEVIVIDDGSDQKNAKQILESLTHPKLTIYKTPNNGLSSARNLGILHSRGKYILPLDSDDLISNTYAEKAIPILENCEDIGIVYAHANFFGSIEGYWPLPDFRISEFMKRNLIYSASFFRKADWKMVGGYKTDMIYGFEDYDFWMSLIGAGKKVYRLPDIHFFYRKHTASMIDSMTPEREIYSRKKIIDRHRDLYLSKLPDLLSRQNPSS